VGGVFIVTFLVTALVGFLAGFFIPGMLLVFFAWMNFLVLLALLAAWNKADEGLTVSVLMTCVVFWLFVFAGGQIATIV
jgi:hypothetical protein